MPITLVTTEALNALDTDHACERARTRTRRRIHAHTHAAVSLNRVHAAGLGVAAFSIFGPFLRVCMATAAGLGECVQRGRSQSDPSILAEARIVYNTNSAGKRARHPASSVQAAAAKWKWHQLAAQISSSSVAMSVKAIFDPLLTPSTLPALILGISYNVSCRVFLSNAFYAMQSWFPAHAVILRISYHKMWSVSAYCILCNAKPILKHMY